MMLIVLLIFIMTFSPVMAKEYENIEVDKKGNLILTPDQYIQLANYIEELEAENKKLEVKLEQAMIELEDAYNDDSIDITGKTLTAAGIVALILVLANQ